MNILNLFNKRNILETVNKKNKLFRIIVYIICMKILKVEEMKLVEDSVKNFFKR